jgi:tetratricopeptide (TPR) repeat protein
VEEAGKLHHTSLAIATDIKYRWNIALSLNSLGRLAYDRGQYRQAEKYQRDSLAIWQELGNQAKVASAMGDLGYVLCALTRTRHQEAEQQFQQALSIAIKLDVRPVTLYILTGLAMLLAESGAGDAEQERAVELLALVLHHPASEQETKDKANRLLDELKSSLPSEMVTAAQERGQAGRLDTIVEKLDSSSLLLAEGI